MKEWHGKRGYHPEFRRKVLDLLEAGREVADVARDLEISEQSIYTWRRQDHVDRGLVPGLTSGEKAELAAATRRIAELEVELAAARRAVCGAVLIFTERSVEMCKDENVRP